MPLRNSKIPATDLNTGAHSLIADVHAHQRVEIGQKLELRST